MQSPSPGPRQKSATSADASTYKKLGQALGTVIGVIAQVGAFFYHTNFDVRF